MNEHDSNSEREDNKKPLGVLSGVGSNPTPRTTDEPTVFCDAQLSLIRAYFGFLKSFVPLNSHTNSKPFSISILASFTVLTLQIP